MNRKAHTQPTKSSEVEKRLRHRLVEVDRQMANDELRSAHSNLDDLYRRHPEHPEILSRLLDTSYEIGDHERYQEVCEKLLAILPEDSELTLALAGAFLLNSRPALARRTFLGFLTHWPDHESAAEVKVSLEEIEQYLTKDAAENRLSLAEEIRLMEMHERMQSLHYQGRYRQAIRLGEEIRRDFPTYLPVYNNLSQLYWLLDQRAKALQLAVSALEIDESNLHARANLVIYRLLSGEVEMARQEAGLLNISPGSPLPQFQKVIEAFSYLGYDQAVLDTYEMAHQREEDPLMGHGSAAMHHLAGAAYLRLGKEQQARECWDLALQLSPDYDHARANRQDLDKPAHLRHAPWCFRIAQWLPEKAVRELLAGFDPSVRTRDEKGLVKIVHEFLERSPAVLDLAPFMLENGDESTRDFLLMLARYSDHPPLLGALQDFALGIRAPDQTRLEAAQILVHSGFLETGMRRLWINGKWIDILLADIRIGGEHRPQHAERVSLLIDEALQLLDAGEGKAAGDILQSALELEPEAPDIKFNMAAALQLQGKDEQSRALVEEIHHSQPDYFFGRTGLAQLHIRNEAYHQAQAVMDPLFQIRSMSPSELDAFCGVNIDLQVGLQNLQAARAWFGFWESANPQHPKQEIYRLKTDEEKTRGAW